ncbi:MAG TPA: hypothetical protein VFG20_12415 [Planctomycetaceae bacterium]|jgi:putative transposase|nr:hypothetical protein [Planctomycetaceae bacterium]
MPNWRRNFVPGGTYFFTVVTHQRRRIFDDLQAIQILGEILRDCQHKHPFQMNALVLLPEHLHAIWTLPRADDRDSMRWGWIKKEFTKRWIKIGGQVGNVSEGRDRERRLGVWQPRFWEHTIENDEDLTPTSTMFTSTL